VENARLLTIVRTQVELARALRRQQKLEAENRSLKPDTRPMLIAEAISMRAVLELISRVGPSEANVLVTERTAPGWYRRAATSRGAVLSGDEHVGFRRTDARNELEHARIEIASAMSIGGCRASGSILGSSFCCRRSARASSTCVRTMVRSRAFSHALHEIARAASHRLDGHLDAAHAVMTTIGRSDRARAAATAVQPFLARRRVARVVSGP